MSDPLLQSTSIPIAGPSTRRKRSSETLDPSSSTTVPTNNNNNNHDDHHDDDDQDRPPARKRIATAESMSQDSGKVVDTQAGVDVFGVDGRETEHQQEQLQGTTRDSINDEQAAQDGRSESYHASLQKALDMAVRTGANRWSAIDLMKAYPALSAGKDRKESFKGLWKRAADEMREKMIVQAEGIMRHYGTEPALDRLEKAVTEARTRKYDILKGEQDVYISDVWRPDLSPQALTAAYNLPRYDAVYTRLREEYIQLYKDCDKLAGEVDGKKKRMDEIKNQVVRANEQLRETADKLEGVPNEGIKMWMGDAASNDKDSRTIA